MKQGPRQLPQGIACLCLIAIVLLTAACSTPRQPRGAAKPTGFRFSVTDLGITQRQVRLGGASPAGAVLQAPNRLDTPLRQPLAQIHQPTWRVVPAPLVAVPHAINRYGQVLAGITTVDTLWTPTSPNGTIGSSIDFGTLFPQRSVTLEALNDYGQVAGQLDGEQAFLWTPVQSHATGGRTTLLATNQSKSYSLEIGGLNNYGQVLLANSMHALWTPSTANGSVGTLTTIPPAKGDVSTDALWLNDYGQVGLMSYDASSDMGRAHVSLWTPETLHGTTGELTAIGDRGAEIRALNAYGQVLGANSFRQTILWTPTQPNGTKGSLITLGGSGDALNDAGTISGYFTTWQPFTFKDEATLWIPKEPNGTHGTWLGLSGVGSDADSFVLGLTRQDEVLGTSCTLERGHEEPYCRTTPHLFLWDSSHGMHELLGLVDEWPNYDLEDRIAQMNAAGQLVVAARDPVTRKGHIFLLTPYATPG